MSEPQIGFWVRRTWSHANFVTKWHLCDSVVAGDVVTRCGRRMADKPGAPFQVSEVMPLTRMIGQPQLCRAGCQAPDFEDDPAVAHEPVET